MRTSREIRLKRYPEGVPGPADFELVEVDLPDLGEGEVIVQNQWMSVDPYMRGRMRQRKSYVAPFALGEVLEGGAVGTILESSNSALPSGSSVRSFRGFRERFVSDGEGLQLIDPGDVPLQAYLGILGMPGMTAYIGLHEIGQIQPGESVFVSGAAGAVGGVACQIAKRQGCRVAGSAGSDSKVDWLRNQAGVDAAFNYKTEDDLDAALATACPGGIDVYYENVGGAHLQAALNLMNDFGRIVTCGMISGYNDLGPAPGPPNLFNIVIKRLKIQGFLVRDHMESEEEFVRQMSSWIASEKITWRETVLDGIDKAPAALIGLFSGDNLGKMLVKLT